MVTAISLEKKLFTSFKFIYLTLITTTFTLKGGKIISCPYDLLKSPEFRNALLFFCLFQGNPGGSNSTSEMRIRGNQYRTVQKGLKGTYHSFVKGYRSLKSYLLS